MHYSIFSSFPDSSIRTLFFFLLSFSLYFGFSTTNRTFCNPCSLTFFLEIHCLFLLPCYYSIAASLLSSFNYRDYLLVRFRSSTSAKGLISFLKYTLILIVTGYRNLHLLSDGNCISNALQKLFCTLIPLSFVSYFLFLPVYCMITLPFIQIAIAILSLFFNTGTLSMTLSAIFV